MTARPSEIAAVADILANPEAIEIAIAAAETAAVRVAEKTGREPKPVDTNKVAATVLIDALEKSREDRRQFAVVLPIHHGPMFAYGPYPTRNRAEEAVTKGHLPMAAIVKSGPWVADLWTPAHALKNLEEAGAR